MLSFLLTQCDEKDQYKVEFLYYNFHSEMLKSAKAQLRLGGVSNYELDAEDVVQNLYLKLTQYIYNIDIDWPADKLKAYMKVSLNNAISDYYNNAKKYGYFEEFDENTMGAVSEKEFLEIINIRERYQEVVCAIKQLDPIYQTTLTFRYLHDMEICEIAKLMGVPDKTVYTRVERGKKHLYNILGVVV